MIGRLVLASVVIGWSLASASPAFATCTVPNTITNGQIADATKVMGNFTALANCAQQGNLTGDVTTSGGGTATTLASTGVTPGVYTSANIAVDAKGRITSAASGSGSGAGGTTLGSLPYAPPSASSFTLLDKPNAITPTITNVANVGLVYSVPITNDTVSYPGVYRAVPTSTSWTLTLRATISTLPGNYPEFGIFIKDSSGRIICQVYEGGLIVKHLNSNVSFNSNPYAAGVVDFPSWLRVFYDGTNIIFSASWDGQNWLITHSETNSDFLNGTLSYVGIGGLTGINDTSLWMPGSKTGAVITYWDINDDPAATRTVH